MVSPILETRFEYRGFVCVVLFQHMGHRCGYVAIPKGNKYYNVYYTEIPVSCHGGLTYSSGELALNDDSDVWWIGFDCNHWKDGRDYPALYKYYFDDKEAMKIIKKIGESDTMFGTQKGTTIRSLDYCIDECINIVDQISEESEE